MICSKWNLRTLLMLSGIKSYCGFLISFFIKISLIYSVLISAVQKSDSVMHIYPFVFIFFSIMIYLRILSIVPCVIQ